MKRYIRADIVDIDDENFSTVHDLIRDSNTGSRTLRRLADRPDLSIKLTQELLRNPNTPEDVFQMAAENYKWLFQAAAEEQNASATLLRVAAQSSDWYDRSIAATHSNTPDEVLQQLCNDENLCVRTGATRNLRQRGLL